MRFTAQGLVLGLVLTVFFSSHASAQQLLKCAPKSSQKLAIQVDGVVYGFAKHVRLLRSTPDVNSPIIAVSFEDALILNGSFFIDWKAFNEQAPRPVILEKHDINVVDTLWNLRTGDFKLDKTRIVIEEANIRALDLVKTDTANCYLMRKSTFLFDKLTKQ